MCGLQRLGEKVRWKILAPFHLTRLHIAFLKFKVFDGTTKMLGQVRCATECALAFAPKSLECKPQPCTPCEFVWMK